jgi:hypothetical protein
MADIIWLSPESPHRQLHTPIVMWRYSDGSLGVAGGADSRTPKNAERVEIRTAGEYRRYAKELNGQLQSKDERREERYAEAMAKMEKHYRLGDGPRNGPRSQRHLPRGAGKGPI